MGNAFAYLRTHQVQRTLPLNRKPFTYHWIPIMYKDFLLENVITHFISEALF